VQILWNFFQESFVLPLLLGCCLPPAIDDEKQQQQQQLHTDTDRESLREKQKTWVSSSLSLSRSLPPFVGGGIDSQFIT